MNLKTRSRTVEYNNKILVSDKKFSLGKNENVNAGLAKPEEEALGPHYMETTKKDLQKLTTIHKVVTKAPQPLTEEKTVITHEEERAALVLSSLVALPFGLCFAELVITILYTAVYKILYNS